MKSKMYLVFAALMTMSNFAMAGQKVMHFTADNPSECELGQVRYKQIYYYPFWIVDDDANRQAVRQCCESYSTRIAWNKAVRECSTAIGDRTACEQAQYYTETRYSDASNTRAECNVEVTLTVQRGGGWH